MINGTYTRLMLFNLLNFLLCTTRAYTFVQCIMHTSTCFLIKWLNLYNPMNTIQIVKKICCFRPIINAPQWVKWNKRPKGPLSLTWVKSTLQKFDFGMEPKTTTLHPTCFKITAMHSVCCYNLLGWRSFWNVPPSLMNWPGWQFLFTFRPEKHKLGRGR